mgnify:CR=1 FL=1
MKGILNFLARAKLVELTPEERVAAEHGSEPVPVDVAPPAAEGSSPPPLNSGITAPPAVATGIDADPFAAESEAVDLAELYAAAGVPSSPYPAEKLLRLLDGLRAMDAATRKAAVLAMDAADDNWQIGDCLADAEAKIGALNAYKQQIDRHLQEREQQSAASVEEIKLALDNASAAIRQQIGELERALERSVTRAAQETTSVEAALRASRESAAREQRRMDVEIEQLREIPNTFKASGAATHG